MRFQLLACHQKCLAELTQEDFMFKAFSCYHSDAGFFYQSLFTFYNNRLGSRGLAFSRSYPTQIELEKDDVLISCDKFILVIPVLNEARFGPSFCATNRLRPAIVDAVNNGRCVILFDYCNESGGYELIAAISGWLRANNVANPSSCILLCQNRLLSTKSSRDLVRVLHVDYFILEAIDCVRRTITQIGLDSYFSQLTSWSTKNASVTCLNATPRLHRIHAILELINKGIVSVNDYNPLSDIRLPYISMSKLCDTKEAASLAPLQLHDYLHDLSLKDLRPHLPWLLSILPLSVDNFEVRGNALSNRIDLLHYTDSIMSIVTETGVDDKHMRLTEKTIKALSLGHPAVVIGHCKSLRMARELGFGVYDGIIDNEYDAIDCHSLRISSAIESAKDFLDRLRSGKVPMNSLEEAMAKNIGWALNGFFEAYWQSNMRAVSEAIVTSGSA